MAKVSSDIDLLVRVGVLEKLLDKLTEKVDRMLSQPTLPENPLASRGNTQVVDEDEWMIDNSTGTVQKVNSIPKDDLQNILDT